MASLDKCLDWGLWIFLGIVLAGSIAAAYFDDQPGILIADLILLGGWIIAATSSRLHKRRQRSVNS